MAAILKFKMATTENLIVIYLRCFTADITAPSLSFLLILLHRPDVQLRIQEEIDNVIGQARLPAKSDLFSMPYTEAAILESLRYATPIPLGIPHCVSHDVMFRGYTIPKGTVVSVTVCL
jgi:cytochrome P450